MKAIRFTFNDFGFVVHAFQRTGANRVVRMVNNAVCMSAESFDKSLNFGIPARLGHPDNDIQQLEESMRFVNSLGIRSMLADFSPIPGTPDGDSCGRWVDMAEPLLHNKTAFPIIALGFDETNRLKDLQPRLNRNLASF